MRIKHLALVSLILFSFLSNAVAANTDKVIEQEVENGLDQEYVEEVEYEVESDTSREPVGLSADQYFSPMTGAEMIFSVLRTYQVLDDSFPSTQGDSSYNAMVGRGAKFILEDLLIGLGIITQHEVFGHGFRAREFHMPVKYSVSLFSGTTSFTLARYNRLAPLEKTAFIIGGMEANTILAKRMRDRWLKSQTLDIREAHLYLRSSLDQTFYILNAHRADKNGSTSGNDVLGYVQELHAWHGKSVLTTRKLKNRVLLDFLDPYFFYSLYSTGRYIAEGIQRLEYPMIQVADYQYLPALRLVLAPYGIEYQWMNFVKGPQYDIQAHLRTGNTGGLRSYAADIEVGRLFTFESVSFDGHLSVWRQPKLFEESAVQVKHALGAAASLVGKYRVMPRIELNGELGYKSTGFLPGEILRHSPILRVGFRAFL